MHQQTDNEIDVDVIVLGGSISASITTLALSSEGASVVLIDTGQHPRFALGESILKPTVYWMRLLAARFNLPQLDVLANVEKINNEIATTSGVKKCFGFVKHQPGQHKARDQWWSNIPVSYEEDVSEAHLFRQDTDAYLFNEAIRACTRVIPGARIKDMEIDSNAVSLGVNQSRINAHYLVDCTSAKSLVADKFELRESPARFRTNSRSIFTHMVNVHPFDECNCAPQPALDWHEGTLHHLLDDAWVWVIPFDNQPRSTNPLVSVGVTFNCYRWPQNEQTAEQEWARLLDTYPALQRQFGDARPVRPWVSTGKLQYSSMQAFGDRYCLLGQSYGGIDALYSRGLLNTMQTIFLVVNKIITALADGDFSTERFKPIEDLQDGLLEINDLLAHGSYCGFGSPRLTTWWLSIWTLVEQQSLAHVQSPLDFALSKKAELATTDWADVDEHLGSGVCIANQLLLLNFLRSGVAIMDRYKKQELDETGVHRELVELSGPLLEIGYDFPTYSRLLKKLGFDPSARIFLQVEHELVLVVEDIDRCLRLEMKLRTTLAVKCIIRLIADTVVASARHAKKSADDAFSSRLPIDIDLGGEQLQTQLKKVVKKLVTDPNKCAHTLKTMSLIHSIKYSEEESCGFPDGNQAEETLDCLLRYSEGDRSTSLYAQTRTTDHIDLYLCAIDGPVCRKFYCTTDSNLLPVRG